MKEIILSADGPCFLYSVPDVVAENLEKYVVMFFKWLQKSPDAKKYRRGRMLCYSESAFIEYLNTVLFPNEPSKMIRNLGWRDMRNKVQPYTEYKGIPVYHF